MQDKNKFRPGLEMLETREVPAGLTGGLSKGVLYINGTSASDTITVQQSGSQIRIAGYTNTWSAGQVSSVVVRAGSGHDTVTLAVDPRLSARSQVDGGSGTDTIRATAKPARYINFERGGLIAYNGGSSSSNSSGGAQNTAGVQIVRTGNTGPYTVSYYRRHSPNTGELQGTYQTLAQANQAVQRLLQWAAQIKANNAEYGITNGGWELVRITVEGKNSTTNTQGGTSTLSALARQVTQTAQEALNQLSRFRNQAVAYIDQLGNHYRQHGNYFRQLRYGVQSVTHSTSQNVIQQYQRLVSQTRAATANFAAQAIRDKARWAENWVNQNLRGEVFSSLRQSIRPVLDGLYDAADAMDNWARALRLSGRG